MIILFHSIIYVGRTIFQILLDKLFCGTYFCNIVDPQFEPRDYKFKSYFFSKRSVQELKQYDVDEMNEVKCVFDGKSGVKFFPPVYAQRYDTVKELIVKNSAKYKISKVVDMGCAELGFFPFLKHLPGVREVIALDVDNQLLESFAHRSAPLLSDHLVHRASPLHVLVLSGNITEHDYRLRDCDVVVAIELIEHLYPQELEEFPFTVFGYIQPNVAIITTPNFDFNILFGHVRVFRHPDHKFEWTRMQFQDWALNITKRYPDYEVTFQGIGKGPFASEFLGCCSQMAVFSRITPKRGSNNDQKEMGELAVGNNEISRNLEVYQIVAQYDYPVYEDKRTETERIQDDLSITIKNLALQHFERKWNLMHSTYEDFDYEDCDEDIYVPFEDIIEGMVEAKLTESELRQLLDGSEWNVKEINGKFVVHYPDPDGDNSSLPEDEEIEEERVAEICTRDPETNSDWEEGAAEEKCVREPEVDSDWDEEKVETCTRGTEDDSDWEQTVAEEKEYSSWPQYVSPSPSCISDWNEEDTQTKAFVDSGYPNSFSGHDKDIANSIDLHSSSLEEDSEDEMEDDMHSSVDAEAVEQAEIHPQMEDMDNQIHLNAAANPNVFYEVVANQDENQDLVNNNRDNEGNNAEAVFREEIIEDVQNVAELSDSEESVMDEPSEDDSEFEDEKLRLRDGNDSSVERVVGQMEVEDSLLSSSALWQDKRVSKETDEVVEDQHQDITMPMSEDMNPDEGFAEAVSSKTAVASGNIKKMTSDEMH